MAEAAKATSVVELYQEQTRIWVHQDGKVKLTDGRILVFTELDPKKDKVKEWIQPKLNAKGLEVLQQYRDRKKDQELVECYATVMFPWFKGGVEQYITDVAKDVMAAAWSEQVLAKTKGRMTLEINEWCIGNARIIINRYMTPVVYEMLCEPFPDSPSGKKADRKTPDDVLIKL